MIPLNQRIQDMLLRRAVLSTRLENATVADVMGIWKRFVARVLAHVAGQSDLFTKERALLGVPAADRLSRLHSSVIGPLRQALDAATAEMVRPLARDLPTFARRELIEVPDLLQAEIDRALATTTRAEALAVEPRLSDEPTTGAKVGVVFGSVPAQQISVLLASPAGGAGYQTAFERLGQQLFGQARGVLIGGLIQGQGTAKVARALQGIMGGARWQAERIVRSEYVRTGNQANLLTFERNKRLLAGVQWHSALDSRTCVVQGFAKVKTNRGWVPIRDIKIGDHVLTHEDRYERVTNVISRQYVGPTVGIAIPGRAVPGRGTVTLTAEHPVYCLRGGAWAWVPARALRVGDELLVPGRPCAGCERVVPEWRTLCSRCIMRRRNKVAPTLQRLFAGCVAAVPVKRVTRKRIRGSPTARRGFARGQIVYDLTVEGGHSFFVNGLAVHNCQQCGALDGKVFKDIAKAPIPVQSTHPACRCVLSPIVLSSKALNLPPGTRASFTGQVPATVTYRDWLPQQDAAFQREVLGPTRYKLWKSGRVKLGDFATAAGVKPISALRVVR